MTRGGPRPNSGPRLYGEPRTRYVPTRLTDTQYRNLTHLATTSGLSRSAVLSSALDRAVSEHRCGECSAEGEGK